MSERERRKCLEVLGLPHSSSDDDIKKAYRRLALQYHPDKNTEDGAKEQFQEISYAYKYLIEGPEAVGVEEEDHGIPLEVLLRLFPWLFPGARFPGFHHGGFFHNPFHPFDDHPFHDHPYFPGFYDDVYYVDSSDEDDYHYDYQHSESKTKSTYVPGPSKEEKKRERKKKARDRRRAAKQAKAAQSTSQPMKETKTDHQTTASNNPKETYTEFTGDMPYTDDVNMPDVKDKSTPSTPRDDSKADDLKTGSSRSSAGRVPQSSQKKKSKKQLREEQRQREKEMQEIAREYKRKQQEKAEKEARKEAARVEKEREATLKAKEAEDSIADADTTNTRSNGLDTEDEPTNVIEDDDDDLDDVNENSDADDGDNDLDDVTSDLDNANDDVDDDDDDDHNGLDKNKEDNDEDYTDYDDDNDISDDDDDNSDIGDEDETKKDKNILLGDKVHNVDDVDEDDLEVDSKEDDIPEWATTNVPAENRFAPLNKQPATKDKCKINGSVSNAKDRPANRTLNTPKTMPDGSHQARQGQKMQYKDHRASSRGPEASSKSSTSDRQQQSSKKIKRHSRHQEAEWEEWPDSPDDSTYDGLMPLSEAEEMRMYHEAILRSQKEAVEQGEKETNKNKSSSSASTRCDELCFFEDVSCSGIETEVIPQTEEEERIMLEAALQQSQITANWHGNIDTLDDVSDGEDSSLFSSGDAAVGGACAGPGAIGDWHKSIDKNTSFLRQNKENVKPKSQFDKGIKLGGFGSGTSGFSCLINTGVEGSQTGYGNKESSLKGSTDGQFDRTVGGKVKGKTEKKSEDSWEFGGSKSSKSFLKTDNAQGLQFGLDDETFLSVNGIGPEPSEYNNKGSDSGSVKNIRSSMFKSAYSTDSQAAAANTSHNASAKQTGIDTLDDLQKKLIRSQILAQLNHPKATPSNDPQTSQSKTASASHQGGQTKPVPSGQQPQHGSSRAASNAKMASSYNLGSKIDDMDDIDDVDTLEESSTPAFSYPSEPASTFDLNIPAKLCNKEKIKSYYQRKK